MMFRYHSVKNWFVSVSKLPSFPELGKPFQSKLLGISNTRFLRLTEIIYLTSVLTGGLAVYAHDCLEGLRGLTSSWLEILF